MTQQFQAIESRSELIEIILLLKLNKVVFFSSFSLFTVQVVDNLQKGMYMRNN